MFIDNDPFGIQEWIETFVFYIILENNCEKIP